MSRLRRPSRAEQEAAARRRHPTALWMPDLDEMRRRAAARAADAVTAPADREDDTPT